MKLNLPIPETSNNLKVALFLGVLCLLSACGEVRVHQGELAGGAPERELLKSLLGKEIAQVTAQLGNPRYTLRQDRDTYLVYSDKATAREYSILVAILPVPLPLPSGKTIGTYCVALTFTDGIFARYEAKHQAGYTDCLDFWPTEQLRAMWETAASEGDFNAAKELVQRFDETASLVHFARKGNREAAAILMEKTGNAKYLHTIANQGDLEAAKQLGRAYELGTGVDRDLERSRFWYSKAVGLKGLIARAQRGEADAQYTLGRMYVVGEAVEKNPSEAMRWFERAAINGDTEAQYALGTLFEFGDEVEQDNVEAIKWYTIAEENSYSGQLRKSYLVKKMTAEEIAEGERLVREWLEAHPQ
jgi:hypothetical protein